MIRLLAILLVIAAIIWAVRRLLGGGPVAAPDDYRAPLVMEPDDPLMLEATAHARASLDEFRRLVGQPNRGARVKVPYRSDTGSEEQLWAEVVAVVGSEVEVRLETQPLSQDAPVANVLRYPIGDLLDWQVELPDGTYAGGHTMRAMFRKGREQWGALPANLADEERKYR